MTIVYTALLGASDTLKPAPTDVDDLLCVCFTDAPDQDPQGWYLKPWQLIDTSRRDAWRIRCRPDLLFPTADQVLWLDASFASVDIAALLRDAGDAELAGLRHHERSSCIEEGQELVAIGQSRSADVLTQLGAYVDAGFEPTTLTTAGILVRRRTPKVRAFNLRWEAEIAAHPGDNTQLSLDYAAWKVGLPVVHLAGTYPDNPYVRYDGEDHHLHRRPYR